MSKEKYSIDCMLTKSFQFQLCMGNGNYFDPDTQENRR